MGELLGGVSTIGIRFFDFVWGEKVHDISGVLGDQMSVAIRHSRVGVAKEGLNLLRRRTGSKPIRGCGVAHVVLAKLLLDAGPSRSGLK